MMLTIGASASDFAAVPTGAHAEEGLTICKDDMLSDCIKKISS